MAFRSELLRSVVPEWRQYYCEYEKLQSFLKLLKQVDMKRAFHFQSRVVNNLRPEERRSVEEIDYVFEKVLCDQVAKFETFTGFKVGWELRKDLIVLIYNLEYFKASKLKGEERNDVCRKLCVVAEKLYKEVSLLQRYLAMNCRIIAKLLREYEKNFSRIALLDPIRIKTLKSLTSSSKIHEMSEELIRVNQLIERLYVERLHTKPQYKRARLELSMITTENQLTASETLVFGIWCGVALVCLAITAFLLWQVGFFSSDPSTFVTYQFPVFRGAFLLILFMLVIGCDVYFWEAFNVNYKRVFNIQLVWCNAYEIMKRAFTFLAFWMLLFVYCCLSEPKAGQNLEVFVPKAALFLSPLIWFLLIFYIVIPTKKALEGQGRRFFFRTVRNLFKAIFFPPQQLDSWFMANLTSLSIPIKDFLYFLCYTFTSLPSGEARNDCIAYPARYSEIAIVPIPMCLSYLFAIQSAWRLWRKKDTTDPKVYSTSMKPLLMNILKNTLVVGTSFFSYFVRGDLFKLSIWLGLATVTAIFTCLWDVFIDWGFFTGNSALPKTTAYRSACFYWFCLIVNLGLRFSFLLTAATSLIPNDFARNTVTLLVGILEMVRRMIWNLLKIENANRGFIGSINAVTLSEDELPFPIRINMNLPEVFKFISEQYLYYTNKWYEGVNKGDEADGVHHYLAELLFFFGKTHKTEERNSLITEISACTEFNIVDVNTIRKELTGLDESLEELVLYHKKLMDEGLFGAASHTPQKIDNDPITPSDIEEAKPRQSTLLLGSEVMNSKVNMPPRLTARNSKISAVVSKMRYFCQATDATNIAENFNELIENVKDNDSDSSNEMDTDFVEMGSMDGQHNDNMKRPSKFKKSPNVSKQQSNLPSTKMDFGDDQEGTERFAQKINHSQRSMIPQIVKKFTTKKVIASDSISKTISPHNFSPKRRK